MGATMGKLLQWLRPSAQPRVNERPGRPAGATVGLPAAAGAGRRNVALAAQCCMPWGWNGAQRRWCCWWGMAPVEQQRARLGLPGLRRLLRANQRVNACSLAVCWNEPAVRQGLLGPRHHHCSHHGLWPLPTPPRMKSRALASTCPHPRAQWRKLQPVLQHAGDQVQRERATPTGWTPQGASGPAAGASCGGAPTTAPDPARMGLAGNAAFVIARRAGKSHGAMLDGRCFLHDYDASQDPDGSVLELLMTAPMLVTHWINWQYHASTCDPVRLGSGNKTPHNVVEATIGVFENNGGDLRIGLSRQSLHDGERWVHEPLRLTVVIDKPGPSNASCTSTPWCASWWTRLAA